MENKFIAVCLMLFTILVVIACVSCLIPVFSSFGTAWIFVCQYISFQIICRVVSSIYNYIKEQLDNSNNEEK